MLHEMKYWFALLCKGWIYIKTHFLHCKTNPQTKIQINFLEVFFFPRDRKEGTATALFIFCWGNELRGP